MASIGDGWPMVVSKRKSKEKKDDTAASGGASIHHRGHFQYFDGNNYPRKIVRSYFSTERFIKFLSMKVPEVIKQILGQIKSFQYFLEKGVSDKDMSIVLQLLLKLCEGFKTDKTNSDTVTIFSELFSGRCNEFQWKLTTFIRKMPYHLHFKESDLRAALDFYCTVLEVIPLTCYNAIPIPYLSEAVSSRESLRSKLDDLLELHRSILEQQTVDSIKKSKISQASIKWDNSEYRNMQVIPEWHEIHDPNPPTRLRPNIISERYEDWMHYYDVQFRLLREDFIAPFRKGIKDYRDGKVGRNISNLRVYHNVKIAKPVFAKNGLCHEITFLIKSMARINWEHSTRLIYGSLVCLSPDNFNHTGFFATITNRELEKLKVGKLTVMFQGEPEIFMHQKKNTLFVMAESIAYYEASSHVLRSLQLAEPTSMPFTKHLLKNNSTKVDPPKYLSICPREAISYDISLIIKKEFIKNPKCARKYSDVKILCHEWPSLEDTDLDASQLRAMKMALTQEVVVIQGPPGTGKTYMGLKIVQALLKNKKYWSPDVVPRPAHEIEKRLPSASGGPILIICFTNHALDQFLEGVLDLHEENKPNIVRVGSKSRSEKLQQYNLAAIKHHQKVLREDLDKYYSKLREVKFLQTMCQQELSRFSDPTLDFAGLPEIKIGMSDQHIQSLQEEADSPEERKWALELWLGLYITKRKVPPQIKRTNDNGHEEESSDSDSESEYASANSSPHESEEELSEEENNGSQKSNVINAQRAEKLEVMKSIYSPVSESQLDTSNTARKEKRKGGSTVTLDDFSGFSSSASLLDAACEDAFMPTWNRYSWNSDGMNECREVMQDQGMFQGEESSYEFNSTNPSRSARKLKIQQKKKQLVEIVQVSNYKKLLPKNLTDSRYGALEAEEIENVHGLEFDARWELYKYWYSKYREKSLEKLEKVCKQYNEACKDLEAAKQKNERYALGNAHIVGMTTTGTAKYQRILHMIKPKIVIVEEAAAIMESHIVSLLNAGTQHLILIGDHKQLRPKPNEYNLVKKYKLDISLFERLVINKFPFVTLENQHRMRPEIAELVHPIYEKLNNHSSVLNYPKVKGVCKNLFLINHSHPEETSVDLSHENKHEAYYLIALCQFLLKKGYAPSQITMLATYSGQFLLIRKLLQEKAITDVKITTVDNFQGEENDIILLSLVRSNKNNIIGFLKEENRVCVSLSRARHGFYCIGNFSMLKKSKQSIWQKIVPDMESKGNVGTALEVHCINHPENKFLVADPEGFDKASPTGGCDLPCGVRLKCGHTCPKNCHLTDPEHRLYKCRNIVCSELKTQPIKSCRHNGEMECGEKIEESLCTKFVRKELRCGHIQKGECYLDIQEIKCRKVRRITLKCGHEHVISCEQSLAKFKCETLCKKTLDCGHIKEVMCFEKPTRDSCKVPTIINLGCGHSKDILCNESCSKQFCNRKCEKELSCGHHCKLQCWQKCACTEFVEHDLACGHRATIKCAAKVESYKCMELCKMKLSCGHQCKRLCSEACTDCCEVMVSQKCDQGHKRKETCHVNQLHPSFCREKCTKMLPCGHPCRKLCYQQCNVTLCCAMVDKLYPCGHSHTMPCSSHLEDNPCDLICKYPLSCGHLCGGKCSECQKTRIHEPCQSSNPLQHFCGGQMRQPCLDLRSKHTKSSTGDKYEGQVINCRHKEISWNCSGEIKKCDAPCGWTCSRQCPSSKRCTNLCHEECNRDPCNEHCPRMMQCGRHRCIGLCGEQCITVCPHCNISQFRHHLALSDTYSEGEAYIQLSCGHIVSVTNMDDFVDDQLLRNDFCLLQCPHSTCLKPLSSSYRYGNVVKRSFKDISSIMQIIGINRGNKDDLFEIYLETCKVLKQPQIKEQCPKELHFTFNKGMKKVCETQRPLREDEQFVLFLIAKLIRFYTHQQYLLSDTATFIAGNLERWLNKNLTHPKLSVQVIYDVLSEYYRLHLDVMITSLPRPPGTQVMDSILKKDSHSRISGKDFVMYSKLLGIRKLEILSELDQFQPRIKIGNWKKCSNGHLYCVPAVTSDCDNLKVCCPRCEGKTF